jgi:hypothetical protein
LWYDGKFQAFIFLIWLIPELLKRLFQASQLQIMTKLCRCLFGIFIFASGFGGLACIVTSVVVELQPTE